MATLLGCGGIVAVTHHRKWGESRIAGKANKANDEDRRASEKDVSDSPSRRKPENHSEEVSETLKGSSEEQDTSSRPEIVPNG